jgi:hypothetical protein
MENLLKNKIAAYIYLFSTGSVIIYQQIFLSFVIVICLFRDAPLNPLNFNFISKIENKNYEQS